MSLQSNLRRFAFLIALFLIGFGNSYAQDAVRAQECPDPPPQTSGIHRFRQQGESFDIPIILADCRPVLLELRWANGRNNGSNFHVTFLDSDNQPIYTKEVSGFMTGSFQFPFAMLEPQPWLSAGSMMSVASVPVTVTVQAVRPFAFPASISYTVTRVSPHPQPKERGFDVPPATLTARDAKNARMVQSSADYAEGKASTHSNE